MFWKRKQGQDSNNGSNNAIFISYRRSVSAYLARAVFQNLRSHHLDVFMDIESIDAGTFDTIILNQIAARPYFVLILTAGSLDRCVNPDDWLRREIVHAIRLQREIVPLMTPDFSFSTESVKSLLVGDLAPLSRYNAIEVPANFFDAAMDRLRTRFLKPIGVSSTAAPQADFPTVENLKKQLAAQPRVTQAEVAAQEAFARAVMLPAENRTEKLTHYNTAIRLNPKYAEAYLNRGNVRDEQGDVEGAMSDYNEALRLNPSFAAGYNNRGFLRHNLGDQQGAISDCSRAISLDPKFAIAFQNRAVAYAAMGQHNLALPDFNEAIRLRPDYAEALNNRGISKAVLGDLDGALADYGNAIRFDPNTASFYVNRSDAYLQKGNLDAAVADGDSAIRLNPNFPEAYYNRANALRLKSSLPQAIADYTKAIQLKPNYTSAYVNRGVVYDTMGDHANAIVNFRKALEVDPRLSQAQNLRNYIVKWSKP